VERDFVDVGVGKDFGQVLQIAFKTTTYQKVSIQSPCGTEGVSHGEACTRFEVAQKFATKSAHDMRQHAPPDDDEVLPQC
jgi:hypothetical protein